MTLTDNNGVPVMPKLSDEVAPDRRYGCNAMYCYTCHGEKYWHKCTLIKNHKNECICWECYSSKMGPISAGNAQPLGQASAERLLASLLRRSRLVEPTYKEVIVLWRHLPG